MHQTLLEYYGPIVIVDHLIGLQEEINWERKPYLECVQFISDMYDEAAKYLPAKHASNFVGRATKTSALALKSRVWMQAASPMVNGNSEWYGDFKNSDGTHLMPQTYDKELWKKALDAAEEAIQQGEYTICCDWNEVDKLLSCFSLEGFTRTITAIKNGKTIAKEVWQYGTEDWAVEKLSNGMFAVLPTNTTPKQKKLFAELLAE